MNQEDAARKLCALRGANIPARVAMGPDGWEVHRLDGRDDLPVPELSPGWALRALKTEANQIAEEKAAERKRLEDERAERCWEEDP